MSHEHLPNHHSHSILEHIQHFADIDWILKNYPFLENRTTLAFLSTTFISIVPFFLLMLIPSHSCHSRSNLMRLLLGFAAGSLIGDTFLHLIPHSLHDYHKTNLHADFVEMCYPIMGGMLIFYVIETIIRYFKIKSTKNLIGQMKKSDSESFNSGSKSSKKQKKKEKRQSFYSNSISSFQI